MLKKNGISQFACYLKWHSDLFASGFGGFSDDFVLSSRWQLVELSKSRRSQMGESLQSSCYIWETRNASVTLKLFKWNHSRLNCRELTSWQGPESWLNKFLLFQGLCDLHLLQMWADCIFCQIPCTFRKIVYWRNIWSDACWSNSLQAGRAKSSNT